MSKGFASNYRVILLAIAVLGAYIGLGARLVWLHVLNREQLLSYVEKARREVIVESGRRGDILDCNGQVLAASRPLTVVGVDPSVVRKDDRPKWSAVAQLLGVPMPELERAMTTRYRISAPAPVAPDAGAAQPEHSAALVFNFSSLESQDADDETELGDADLPGGRRPIKWSTLADGVSEETYAAVLKLGVQGIYGRREFRRAYPHNAMAAHVIGYVNRQERPFTGIERFADFYLRGHDGWLETEKDGRRQELPQFRSREVPPSDGYNVRLTIDAGVQNVVENEVRNLVEKLHPRKITVIVSDPRTGALLALANYPSFDLNGYGKLQGAQVDALHDIALEDEYEPGSVFKIVAVSGALNDGIVTPRTTFDCRLDEAPDQTGRMYGLAREDAGDLAKGYFDRPNTVAEIIQHSSNKGTAQIALKLGRERFYQYIRAYGFGQRTGLPLGGEIFGSIAQPANWLGKSVTRIPIGQGVAVTAIQMHMAMGVVASGGELLRPQIVRDIRDSQGRTVFSFGRSPVRRVISEDTARTMAQMLTGVVSDHGTAVGATIPNYEVAGKTATAQKLEAFDPADPHRIRGYSTTHHVSSFIGFFPASQPKLEISVIIDDTDEKFFGAVAYGGKVAAPAFNRIGTQLIQYRDISPPPLGGRAAGSVLALMGGAP